MICKVLQCDTVQCDTVDAIFPRIVPLKETQDMQHSYVQRDVCLLKGGSCSGEGVLPQNGINWWTVPTGIVETFQVTVGPTE